MRVDYGNATHATYSYDAAGQVLAIAYGDESGNVETAFGYGYDAAGNRTYKAFADGSKESYGYDDLNRLTRVDYPSGRHVEYAYDAVGNRTSMVDTQGVSTRWASSASASSQAYPASYATGAPDVGGCAVYGTGTWMPNKPGGAGSPSPEWLQVRFASAARAKGLRIHETKGGKFVQRVDLIDDQGQAHTVYSGGDSTACGGWLVVSFDLTPYPVAGAKVYTQLNDLEGIDAVGLDVASASTYAYNGFNQLTGITGTDGGATTFGYDGNGNQVRKTEMPASGAAQLTRYVYNQDNRLVGIALPNGQSNAFEYDANGLRTKKTDSSGTTSYLLDGLSVLAQYAPDGARQAWYTPSLARIDEVLSVVNGQGKFWYQSDALGSTYALADNAGNVAARGGYDVFGVPVAISGSVGQPFGFTGREHDLDSGLVYSRARYLQPSAGRFTNEDPINLRTTQLPLGTQQWLSTGGVGLADALAVAAVMGRYDYAGSNPSRHADPTGELLANTVGQGLSMAAAILSITAFASMLPMLLIFKVAMAVQEYGLAEAAADTLVGLAITVVVSAIAMVAVAPEMIAALMGLYPTVALAAGYLLCLGIAGAKWVNRGCPKLGTRELYGWATCTLSLGVAVDTGNPWRLLRPNPS